MQNTLPVLAVINSISIGTPCLASPCSSSCWVVMNLGGAQMQSLMGSGWLGPRVWKATSGTGSAGNGNLPVEKQQAFPQVEMAG